MGVIVHFQSTAVLDDGSYREFVVQSTAVVDGGGLWSSQRRWWIKGIVVQSTSVVDSGSCSSVHSGGGAGATGGGSDGAHHPAPLPTMAVCLRDALPGHV